MRTFTATALPLQQAVPLTPARRARCTHYCAAEPDKASTSGSKGVPSASARGESADAPQPRAATMLADPPAPTPETPDTSNAAVHMRSAIAFLKEELSRMFTTGEVTRARFDKNVDFQDPISSYNTLDGYCFNIRVLATIFDTTFDLFDIGESGQNEITARWHLQLNFKLLPWKPSAAFTGTSVFAVDPATGLITKHIDKWDAVDNNKFLSLEGLQYVLSSLGEVKLTPDLETPDFTRLVKTKEYEIRAYQPYVVAETPMPTGSGPASGSGFMDLAGYIFGGNEAKLSMDMTTPVYSTGGQGDTSSMQFVMSRRYQPEDLPAPTAEGNAITAKREGAGVRAAKTFSGFPLDHEVVQAERELRTALERDGLEPREGYLLARYNEPTVPPFLRRNEVLIELANYELPKVA